MPDLLTRLMFLLLALLTSAAALEARAAKTQVILVVAGETALVDKTGHHDYLAAGKLLVDLLEQTPDVKAILIEDGWPKDELLFVGADAVVFYTDGGGKQAYLQSAGRVDMIQAMANRGVGIVQLHQAVDYPDAFTQQAAGWGGGTYVQKKSGRGHWDSHHADFPSHPVTRGVTPWKINDGWLNDIRFTADIKNITPLVWSGKQHTGAPQGGTQDVVGWAFDRPGGGRSFSFTGIDAHDSWKLAGMRQLIVNGILWSAGAEIPKTGAANTLTNKTIDRYLTPRTAKPKK